MTTKEEGTLIRISEAGNGFPQISDPLIHEDGEVWQILSFEGPIQTKQWEANWIMARAEYVRDAEEDEEGFPCSWEVEEEVPVYTYTIYDANPASSSGTEWPSHSDMELDVNDDDEAKEAAQSALESAALECRPEDGYVVGNTLYLQVFRDGEWLADLTYEVTAEDLGIDEEEDMEDDGEDLGVEEDYKEED